MHEYYMRAGHQTDLIDFISLYNVRIIAKFQQCMH